MKGEAMGCEHCKVGNGIDCCLEAARSTLASRDKWIEIHQKNERESVLRKDAIEFAQFMKEHFVRIQDFGRAKGCENWVEHFTLEPETVPPQNRKTARRQAEAPPHVKGSVLPEEQRTEERRGPKQKPICTVEQFLTMTKAFPGISECDVMAQLQEMRPRLDPADGKEADKAIADHVQKCGCSPVSILKRAAAVRDAREKRRLHRRGEL